MPQGGGGRRWAPDVQRRAEELGRDRDLTASDVRRVLREELSADVPVSTVQRWVADVRRREPIDRNALISDVADRATVLLSAELSRQERLSPSGRDLGRIDSIARTLKTLSTVSTGKAGAARQTLADLQTDAQTPDGQEGPMRLAS